MIYITRLTNPQPTSVSANHRTCYIAVLEKRRIWFACVRVAILSKVKVHCVQDVCDKLQILQQLICQEVYGSYSPSSVNALFDLVCVTSLQAPVVDPMWYLCKSVMLRLHVETCGNV